MEDECFIKNHSLNALKLSKLFVNEHIQYINKDKPTSKKQ
jgi:hypothetical protein